MKSLFNFSNLSRIIAVLVIFFLLIGCEKEREKCQETSISEFNLRISPDVKIVHKDGKPFDGIVTFNIYKSYCSGEISGSFSKEATTNSEGMANFHYAYIYLFGNTKDVIYFTYVIKQNGKSHEEKGKMTYNKLIKHTISYVWVSIEMFKDYYNKKPIVLPWNKQ